MGMSATGASMGTEDLEIRILIEELRKTDPEAAQCYEAGRSDCLQMNWGIVPVPAGLGNPSAAMGLVRACAFVRNLFGATRTTGAVARTEATAAALFSPNGLASEVGLIRSLSHAVASTDAGRNLGSFSLWAAAGLTTLVSGEYSANSGGIEGLEITERPDGTLDIRYGDQVGELPPGDRGFVIIRGNEGPDDTITIYRERGGTYDISHINNPRTPRITPTDVDIIGGEWAAPATDTGDVARMGIVDGHLISTPLIDRLRKTPVIGKIIDRFLPKKPGIRSGHKESVGTPGAGEGEVPKEKGPRGNGIVGRDMN